MDEVILQVESSDAFWARALAMARRLDEGDYAPEPTILTFPTLDGFLRLMTPERWHLLRALRHHGTISIPGLATLLERDEQSVEADVAALLAVDLIAADDAGHVAVLWSKISAEMDLGQAA